MRFYQTKANITGSDTPVAGFLNSGEFNSIAQELENAVVSAGLTPVVAAGTSEIFIQLAQAISSFGMGKSQSTYVVSSTNDDIILDNWDSNVVPPLAYFAGMTISFAATADTSGATTVDYAGLGEKPVYKLPSWAALTGGEIQHGEWIHLEYSTGGAGFFKLRGGEAITQSIAQNGYVFLPIGVDGERLLIQWGSDNATPAGLTVTYPIAYPNGALIAVGTDKGAGTAHIINTVVSGLTTFVLYTDAVGADATDWISIGY